jgi:hypothetical protein
MREGYIELAYLFCDKGKIEIWYTPVVWTVRRTERSSFGERKSIKKSSNIWIIKSGCDIYGKSQEKVKKGLKKQII